MSHTSPPPTHDVCSAGFRSCRVTNMSKEADNKKKPGGLGAFFNSLGGAIDDVMNEVKADLKAMTPPDETDKKKAAERDADQNRIASLLGQSTFGLSETVFNDPDVPELAPEQDPNAPQQEAKPNNSLPPGNLWLALTTPQFSVKLRTDACYHALTQADVGTYRRSLAAEKESPFTMGICAVVLQAPLEEELEEGGAILSEDLLLLSLLKSLEETRMYGAIGAGPRQLWPNFDALDESLTTLLNTHPKLIALGPLGIDEPFAPYHLAQQMEQLAVQLDIAADFDLPVILTHRQSLAHVRTVLEQAERLPPIIWLDVLTTEEDLALVKRFNMYTVLRPEITAPDFPHAHLYRNVTEDRRLIASGSALVAPHGFQGHFNQPKFLKNSLQAGVKLLFMSEKELTLATNTNLARLFQK
ncbi:MAG: hypothetical protein EON60_02860 [Alphaproteobacteria bacterium]|nr:MAG: hypothetical protein EON60_02860 [Alphaproteobacteria bacterium]